ncbi:hypothetical protein HOE425_290016 [Hoeflea sp. EC-HK425]|nr:hypothetical protein HOE425_290016 [Hoeflea sp. EC-HK425]
MPVLHGIAIDPFLILSSPQSDFWIFHAPASFAVFIVVFAGLAGCPRRPAHVADRIPGRECLPPDIVSPMSVGGDQIGARPVIFAPAVCEAGQRFRIAGLVGNAPGKALRGTVREVRVDVLALAKDLGGVAGRAHGPEGEYEQPTDAPPQSFSRVARDEASWQGREGKLPAIDGPTDVRQGVPGALGIKIAVTQRPVRRHCKDCKLDHEATAEIW